MHAIQAILVEERRSITDKYQWSTRLVAEFSDNFLFFLERQLARDVCSARLSLILPLLFGSIIKTVIRSMTFVEIGDELFDSWERNLPRIINFYRRCTRECHLRILEHFIIIECQFENNRGCWSRLKTRSNSHQFEMDVIFNKIYLFEFVDDQKSVFLVQQIFVVFDWILRKICYLVKILISIQNFCGTFNIA